MSPNGLQAIGCEQYTALVLKEDLDGGLLVKLQDQELLDFGIKNSFHRKENIDQIAKLLEPENCHRRENACH